MSKAILVLPEMPECCLVCPLCVNNGELGDCAAAEEITIIDFTENEFRPDWCPLIESDEIEKLIPKKVIMGKYAHRCPNCRACVEGCRKFCRECGQALSWEDDEQ